MTHILIINIVLNDLDGKHVYFALCPGHPSECPSVLGRHASSGLEEASTLLFFFLVIGTSDH